jgi:hypothetical protein
LSGRLAVVSGSSATVIAASAFAVDLLEDDVGVTSIAAVS